MIISHDKLLLYFFISLLFILLIYLNWQCNNLQFKSNKNFNIGYNKLYINIAIESYNKFPNLEKELECLYHYYRDKSIYYYFIIDGIRLFAHSIRMSNITYNLKYSNGDIALNYFQMKHYHHLISSYDNVNRIKYICEIGFQLGVGALTLITSVKHVVNYFGFDYGKKYSRNAYQIISKYFPMKIIWGKSQITIPNILKNRSNFEKCDIVHIDGCHSQSSIYKDILNMKNLSHHKSLLLVDDVNLSSKSVIMAIKNKLITNVICYNKPYCVAFYI